MWHIYLWLSVVNFYIYLCKLKANCEFHVFCNYAGETEVGNMFLNHMKLERAT